MDNKNINTARALLANKKILHKVVIGDLTWKRISQSTQGCRYTVIKWIKWQPHFRHRINDYLLKAINANPLNTTLRSNYALFCERFNIKQIQLPSIPNVDKKPLTDFQNANNNKTHTQKVTPKPPAGHEDFTTIAHFLKERYGDMEKRYRNTTERGHGSYFLFLITDSSGRLVPVMRHSPTSLPMVRIRANSIPRIFAESAPNENSFHVQWGNLEDAAMARVRLSLNRLKKLALLVASGIRNVNVPPLAAHLIPSKGGSWCPYIRSFHLKAILASEKNPVMQLVFSEITEEQFKQRLSRKMSNETKSSSILCDDLMRKVCNLLTASEALALAFTNKTHYNVIATNLCAHAAWETWQTVPAIKTKLKAIISKYFPTLNPLIANIRPALKGVELDYKEVSKGIKAKLLEYELNLATGKRGPLLQENH